MKTDRSYFAVIGARGGRIGGRSRSPAKVAAARKNATKSTACKIREFWSAVNIGGLDECWEWRKGRSGSNYGEFGNNGAHRFAWQQARGPIPRGMFVLHSCDNPPCCNPVHLFLGTAKDNAIDCHKKGRHRPPRGTEHYQSKLTEESVLAIRHLSKAGEISCRQMALMIGVAPVTVVNVVNRKTWTHI